MKATNGSEYRIASIPSIFNATYGGNSLDWVIGVLGVKYSYGMELRPNEGRDGFLLPTDQILPTAEEVWAWHKAMAYQMIAEYNP